MIRFTAMGTRSTLLIAYMFLVTILVGQQPAGSPQVPAPAAPGAGRGRGPGRNGLGGAAAGFVQNATYDKDPPQLPTEIKPGGVLIFSKTSGFREEASIEASNAALAVIAKERGWPYFITE